MAHTLPLPPDEALGAPQYDCRRPSMAPRIKLEDSVSPKSVIADIRFISPASSSSSSMDHRPLSDANYVKSQQPRHDRGYSISDGESSDQDTLLEPSRELSKFCAISGSLESLPETHSLPLKATRINVCREGKAYQSSALLPSIEDKHQIQQSKGMTQQLLTLSDHTSAQGSISISATDSQTGLLRSDPLSCEEAPFSSHDTSALNRFDEENRGSTIRSPVDFPGTPIRFSPGWHAQLRSPGGSHISFGSPGVEKGHGLHSPASLADHLSRGISFQQRFFSGPLQGGKSPRPPPSKWDDAEKWIVSPGHHESSPQPQLHRPTVQALPSGCLTGRRHSISGNCHRPNFGLGSPEFSTLNAAETPLFPTFEHTNRKGESLTRSASQKKRSKALSFGDLSKRVFDLSCSDACQTTDTLPIKVDRQVTEMEVSSETTSQRNNHETQSNEVKELDRKDAIRSNVRPSAQSRDWGSFESLVNDKSKTQGIARYVDNSMDVEILKHPLTESMEIDSNQQQPPCTAGLPPPSEHSWKFGRRTSSTGSHKNSKCTTPALTASPTRHNTPARSGRRPASFGSLAGAGELEFQICQFTKLEVSNLGGDDRSNKAWVTREEEDMECSASLRDNDSGVLDRGVYDEKTAAQWEEAEQTGENERCDKEEARIKAWEELQTSKAETEMQKLEMKIEKMRLRALEKMSNRIALASKKAKEMRASASARATRSNQSAKAMQQVNQIHIPVLGHVSPLPKSPFKCCFKP